MANDTNSDDEDITSLSSRFKYLKSDIVQSTITTRENEGQGFLKRRRLEKGVLTNYFSKSDKINSDIQETHVQNTDKPCRRPKSDKAANIDVAYVQISDSLVSTLFKGIII